MDKVEDISVLFNRAYWGESMKKGNGKRVYDDREGLLIIQNEIIIACNNHLLNILKVSSDKEVIGSGFSRFIAEKQPNEKSSQKLYRESLRSAKMHGKWKGDFRLKTIEEEFIAEVRFVKSNSGKIAGIIKKGNVDKIPEEDFERDKSIFNNGYIPMLIIDSEDGRIIEANPSACRFYGYTKEIMKKKKISDINILTKKEVSIEMEKAQEEKRNFFLFKHKLSNGQIRDVEVNSWPIAFRNKTMLFSIIHDIKERNIYMDKFKIQESYFKDLFENSPEAIAMADNELNILDVNKSFEEIFLYKKNEIIGKNIKDILSGEEYYSESQYFQESINKGDFIREEILRKRKDGKFINVSLIGCPITFKGKQIGIYCIYSDLSKIKEEERRKKLFSEVFKNNTVGIVITDSEGNIQWVNNAFTEITGYKSDEAEGRKTNILKSGKQSQEFYDNMWSHIINEGKWQGEICSKRKNGELYQEWLNIIAVRGNDGHLEYLVGMISDITDARKKDKRIEILTSKDHLTELHNRDYFNNKLNYLLRKNGKHGKMGVLFLDIDDFKEINDNLGHLAGDLVLIEFASRLKKTIRESDLAARFGGDEFIILLTKVNNDTEIMNITSRILKGVSGIYEIENQEMHVTASIGIARYPEDGTDSTTLIRNADIAMYRAKEKQNHKITMFQSELNQEVIESFHLKNNLRQALSKGQLFLKYQPIFDTEKESISGIEALLRWKTGDNKIIPPSKFIPIAEKNGMIIPIGEWVMEKACRQNKQWQRQGLKHVYISVNVSILQLEHPGFCKFIKKILEETGLEPRYLQMEITETIFTRNYGAISKTIEELSRIGIRIAIDDFGTGYSSLSQLINMKITNLKIDKSFIGSVCENGNMRKIVKTIISMAESLSLELIAEGVETIGQLNFLKRNKCNMIQGYLLSYPKDSKSIEEYLRNPKKYRG